MRDEDVHQDDREGHALGQGGEFVNKLPDGEVPEGVDRLLRTDQPLNVEVGRDLIELAVDLTAGKDVFEEVLALHALILVDEGVKVGKQPLADVFRDRELLVGNQHIRHIARKDVVAEAGLSCVGIVIGVVLRVVHNPDEVLVGGKVVLDDLLLQIVGIACRCDRDEVLRRDLTVRHLGKDGDGVGRGIVARVIVASEGGDSAIGQHRIIAVGIDVIRVDVVEDLRRGVGRALPRGHASLGIEVKFAVRIAHQTAAV